METSYSVNGVHHDSLAYIDNLVPITNNFELHDFIDDPNFDQFINLIRGETEDAICNFSSDFVDHNQLLSSFPPPAIDTANNLNAYDSIPISSNIEGEETKKGEENDDGGTSSSSKKKAKTDRAKTVISERRRRVRMKDLLYALRALVPNITKMDKASIIKDAISYVHDLQTQVKKLKVEVVGLETSLPMFENIQASAHNNVQVTHNNHIIYKKIIQVDMFQVEERGYYTKIVCNRGERVAASLYKALESLTDFNVRNSNLATIGDNYLLTFTFNVKAVGYEQDQLNLQHLKLWVAGALLSQGFEFMPSFHV